MGRARRKNLQPATVGSSQSARVAQSTECSLTGALLVQEGQLSRGRSVVLSGNGEAGWVSRLTVKSLYALSKAANKTMSLAGNSA